MALCVCKCLNITLESDKIDQISDIGKLNLSPSEQRDVFFSEKLLLCLLSELKVSTAQPALVTQRNLGRWILYSCLSCGQTTHGVLQEDNIVAIPKELQTSRETINNLKQLSNFSSVFNILVPELTGDNEMKENIDTNILVRKPPQPADEVIRNLNKQLNNKLQLQLENIEESIRQFRDQKYIEYEAYRERAQRDHNILASIISKSTSVDDTMDTNSDQPPSPHLPPLQRRRLSSIKEAKKHVQNLQDKLSSQSTFEEDSLDAEDIFDLEGTDSRHDMDSDQDDYDSDQSGSRDEGIHIAGVRSSGPRNGVAQSLPVAVPQMFLDRPARQERELQDPQDIAASIKAIAKSVHGDVFELPRPRFSTQI